MTRPDHLTAPTLDDDGTCCTVANVHALLRENFAKADAVLDIELAPKSLHFRRSRSKVYGRAARVGDFLRSVRKRFKFHPV
jgi:hypothetical protein